MTSLLQDLKYGLRAMTKTPGFTIVALTTLVLGIGANTAIFSVVNAVLFRPLPYKDAGQIVTITTDPNDKAAGTAYEHYQLWKSGSRSFEEMAVLYRNISWSRVTMTIPDNPEKVQGGYMSASTFSILGVPPALGRTFTEQEETERQRVVVLSDQLWKQRFGGAADVLGKSLPLEGENFEVIGVMPESFQYPGRDTQLWAPITTNRLWLLRPARDNMHNLNYYWRWNIIARLKPGVTLETARSELEMLTRNSGDPNLASDKGISLFPMRVDVQPNARLSLLILMGAVSLVLLIACINVSNLLLARGIAREHEFAIRMALGAPRSRIVRQLMTENLALALIAGVFGLVLAIIGVKVLISFGPQDIPRLEQVSLDSRVLWFTLLVSILAAVISGLLPAWKVSQGSFVEALQHDGRTMAGSSGRKRTAGFLIGLEFTLSMVLLTGAGLLVRSFANLQDMNPGFQAELAVAMHVELASRTTTIPQRAAFTDQVLERIGALPEVQSVGGTKELFLAEDYLPMGLRAIEGREPERKEDWTPLIWTTVSGDYFSAMGAPLLKGRYFSAADGMDSPPVVIIDEYMARRFWPGQDPIGKFFKGFDPRGKNDDWVTVIGLVGPMHLEGLENRPAAHIFEWHKQKREHYSTPDIVARTAGDPQRLIGSMRTVIHSVDSGAIISGDSTVQAELNQQLAPRLFQTWLVGIFSVIALILASVGVYGLMHYTVARRRHEIGVRMALGAQARTIVAMIVRQGVLMAAAGLMVGLVGSLWVNHLISNLLYGVTPTDPVTFACVSVLLLSVAVAATLIPAWRAAKADPSAVLRNK